MPYNDFLHLVEQAEMVEDIQNYDQMISKLRNGEEEEIPAEEVHVLLDNKKPVYIRTHVNLEKEQLIRLDKIARQECRVPYSSVKCGDFKNLFKNLHNPGHVGHFLKPNQIR